MHMSLQANKLGALGILIEDRVQLALADLSPSAGGLLSMLYFKPHLIISELALIAGVVQPTATRVMDHLVRNGYVERAKQQGRIVPLVLTRKGRARAAALQLARLTALDDLLQVLSPDHRQQFDLLIDQILMGATTSRAFARTTCRLCEHDLCSSEVCPIACRATELERSDKKGRGAR